ncbi:MAG: hypothetical protein PHT94_00710 [Candidatus Nanoarchaeia archaeon]|nr:hypothetical protein [Candidatus Nanoarchaeia archaeon]
MSYNNRSTEDAFKIDRSKMSDEMIRKFYIKKNGRIFISNYGLSCGYTDIQKTHDGTFQIIKDGLGFYISFYDKNNKMIKENIFFKNITMARNFILSISEIGNYI